MAPINYAYDGCQDTGDIAVIWILQSKISHLFRQSAYHHATFKILIARVNWFSKSTYKIEYAQRQIRHSCCGLPSFFHKAKISPCCSSLGLQASKSRQIKVVDLLCPLICTMAITCLIFLSSDKR